MYNMLESRWQFLQFPTVLYIVPRKFFKRVIKKKDGLFTSFGVYLTQYLIYVTMFQRDIRYRGIRAGDTKLRLLEYTIRSAISECASANFRRWDIYRIFSSGERESIGLNQSDPREETRKGLKVEEAAKVYAKEAERGRERSASLKNKKM